MGRCPTPYPGPPARPVSPVHRAPPAPVASSSSTSSPIVPSAAIRWPSCSTPTIVVQLASALGVPRSSVLAHAWADNGPGWRVLELESAEQVLSLTPDLAWMADAKLGVLGRHSSAGTDRAGTDLLYEVRAFTLGGIEDPVTGSLNAGIAQWLVGREPMPARWAAAQGTALEREGRIDVQVEGDGTIWIGGATVLTVEGSILV